ncbi:B12-binding domain-containing radical SAM protein [Nocardioides KLBMP 9356]|uniref:B12-binding domain-containing radical SAM protein n=1 Tax=Nocardioides potassii TaxID=2911371 RepID=A0ABS9HD00_9ACTN|nr:radical SAM protein [Nocardioides potassii]MCF6377991.1 B12-binding domain-containing radical SAM protein [Nocardioides potassii]
MNTAAEVGTVLLVHPGIYNDFNPLAFPPWGALSVASHLRAHDINTVVADLNGQDIYASMTALLREHAPAVVGFTCKLGLAARRFREAVECVRRERGDDVRIVAGGPLVSTYPDPLHPLWDSVDNLLLGDGESALLTLLTDPEGANHSAHSEVDLNEVGWGMWWPELGDYVRPAEYWPNMNARGMHVASARGCTRRCTFCYLNTHVPGKRFRYVGAERLFDRLIDLRETFNTTGYYFVDDCFIDRGQHRLNDFIEVNRSHGNPFVYGCDVQLPDLADPATLERMHTSGFRCLYLGIEAASPAVRKSLGKGSVREPVETLVNRALDMGFLIRASIGIGWPGETLEEMKATVDLIGRVDRLAFDAYKFFPLPGTPLGESAYWAARRDMALTKDQLLEDSYADYSEFNANYSGVPDAELEEVWGHMLDLEQSRLAAYAATPMFPPPPPAT